jgi:oxygen-independent coproporphyrinogen-3 oxidase
LEDRTIGGTTSSKIGIYTHIPFCRRACFYCHFFKAPFSEEAAQPYIEAVGIEARLRADPQFIADTMYIGGGSPSLLSSTQLDSLLNHIHRNFSIAPEAEITVECNPEDVTLPLLKSFRALGVNRLSIGTQSFVQEDLDVLRRPHSAEQSLQAVELAREAGFDNINIDYILSIPGQTAQSLGKSLQMVKRLGVPHVSAYLLEGVRQESDQEDERDRELYHLTVRELEKMGLQHYEVSNFAKPGKRSQHNLKYWRNEPYIGLGASASGFLEGRDYQNIDNLENYLDLLQKGQLPESEVEAQDLETRAIVMGLRLLEGLPEETFTSPEHQEALNFLLDSGMLVRQRGQVHVPPDNILLLNEILSYFI